MRQLIPCSMAALIALLPVACSTTQSVTKTESESKSPSFGGDDIRFFVETAATELLSVRPDDFASQKSIPVELKGCIGEVPDTIFGRPTLKVADLSTALGDNYDITAMRLVVLEERDGKVKVRISHIALTYSANAEAWMRRENGKWRVAEVLSRWNNL